MTRPKWRLTACLWAQQRLCYDLRSAIIVVFKRIVTFLFLTYTQLFARFTILFNEQLLTTADGPACEGRATQKSKIQVLDDTHLSLWNDTRPDFVDKVIPLCIQQHRCIQHADRLSYAQVKKAAKKKKTFLSEWHPTNSAIWVSDLNKCKGVLTQAAKCWEWKNCDSCLSEYTFTKRRVFSFTTYLLFIQLWPSGDQTRLPVILQRIAEWF